MRKEIKSCLVETRGSAQGKKTRWVIVAMYKETKLCLKGTYGCAQGNEAKSVHDGAVW